MSTYLYPQGMSSYNNRLPQGGNQSWKSQTFHGTSSANVRPYANKVPNIIIPAPFGKPRPLKQYRKGILPPNIDPYFRVKSQAQSLNGGLSTMGQINIPGGYQANQQCSTNCDGVGVVNILPIITDNLSDNPNIITTTPEFCCNPQRNAEKMVIYASQSYNNPNYYTSYTQYMQNKCETYEQKVANFVKPVLCDPYSNSYIVDCQYVLNDSAINKKRCNVAIYKPNNRRFLAQGAVSSSAKILRDNTNTLRCNGGALAPISNAVVRTSGIYSKNIGNTIPPKCLSGCNTESE